MFQQLDKREKYLNFIHKNLPKPIKALRIHLNAGFFRNGKIIAPPNAEQLIKLTAINPTKISKIPIEITTSKKQTTPYLLFHVARPGALRHPSLNLTETKAGNIR